MAAITPTVTEIGPKEYRVVWSDAATGDTIVAHNSRSLTQIASVQTSGTFSGGTSVGLTVSIDNTNYATASDMTDTDISGKTAAFLSSILDNATSFLPTIDSGSADSVTFTLTYRIY